MSVVMGLDLSLTSTGVTVIDHPDGDYRAFAIRSKARGEERVDQIRRAILSELDHHPTGRCFVCIEGYAYHNLSTLALLAELGGVVKNGLYRAGVPFRVIPPAVVKKFATGKGNAQKDEMRLAVFKKWGFEAKTTDEVDAYVLARIGLALLGDTELLAYEKAALAKLDKGVA